MKILQVNRYNGYLMRSHSETRWAALMDALGIRWLYESRAVKTRHGMYLPDFILPLAGIAVEVKGPGATPGEVDKAADASIALKMPVAVVWGVLDSDGMRVIHGQVLLIYGKARIRYTTEELSNLVWHEAPQDIWSQMMKVARKEKYLPLRPALEKLDEVMFTEIYDKKTCEQVRREVAAELNEEKGVRDLESGLIEKAIQSLAATVVERVEYHEPRRAG